jgi:Tfp pilus assembly protein PilN
MRAVNLLPREVTKTKSRRPSAPLITAFVTGVVVFTILAAAFFKESASVSSKRTDLQAARAELAQVPGPTAPDNSIKTLNGEEAKRIAALQSALDGRIAWDRVLREVSLVLPSNVWLSSLTLQAPASATPIPGTTTGTTTPTTTTTPSTVAAPTDFVMNGNAFKHVDVARLMARLALVPDLENVTLNHSTRATPSATNGAKTKPSVEFSVVAGVRTPGGTP